MAADFIMKGYNQQTGELDINAVMAEAEHQKINRLQKEKCNIILCGATGTGKSTLINAVFGEDIVKAGVGKPVTQHLEKIDISEKGICLWDTKGIESKNYLATIQQLKEELSSEVDNADSAVDFPHLAWLCIKATSARIEERDFSLIELLKQRKIPVVIVFTNVIGKAEKVFVEVAKQEIDKRYAYFIDDAYAFVNSIEYEVSDEVRIPKRGLEQLIDASQKLFLVGRYEARNTFLQIQTIKHELKLNAIKAQATTIIHQAAEKHSLLTLQDIDTVAAIRAAMLLELNAAFDLRSMTDIDSQTEQLTVLLSAVIEQTSDVVVTVQTIGLLSIAALIVPVIGAAGVIGAAAGVFTSNVRAATLKAGFAYLTLLERLFDKEVGKVIFPDDIALIIATFKEIWESNEWQQKN